MKEGRGDLPKDTSLAKVRPGDQGPSLSQLHCLPPEVSQVSKDVIRGFSHHKKVGAYLLGRSLGEGSFAKVKQGLHLTTGEKVAVKVIDKKRAKVDRYVRKNLRREARLLQQIRHDHVVQLLEVMETEHCYYLVTEYCAGGDLMDYISKRKRLDEKEAKRFIRQIVSAVDYLHRLGIIHRDLKIENLLLDESRNIKLIDFGLSNTIKVGAALEGTGHAQEYLVTQCGSPAYAAPELLNHQKYGLEVDVWSIGVNMYAMLTGSLPFTVDPFNIKTLYNKMVSGQMNPLPPGLSPEARDILDKLLTADPVQRLTISEALCHPWLAEGRNKPMERPPFPNKLKSNDLNSDVIKHMSDHLDFRMSEIIRYVVGNIPSSACATYHLFERKLLRHLAEKSFQGKEPNSGDSKSGRTSIFQPKQELLPSRKTSTCTQSRQARTSGDMATKTGTTGNNSHSPFPDGLRKLLETPRTTMMSRQTVEIVLKDKEKSRVDREDSRIKQQSDRQEETALPSRPSLSHRHKPDHPSTIPKHHPPGPRTIPKPAHVNQGPGTAKKSGVHAPTTPRIMDAKPGVSTPAHHSSAKYTRGRTLLPMDRASTFYRQDIHKEKVFNSSCDGKDGADDDGCVNGNFILRTACPATSTSVKCGPNFCVPSANNAFTSQHMLARRFKNERWRSVQSRANTDVEVCEDIVRLTPTGHRDTHKKLPASQQTLPTIRQLTAKSGPQKHVHHSPDLSVSEHRQKCYGKRLEDRLATKTPPSSPQPAVMEQRPVSQSLVSSPTRDLHMLPVISSGSTSHN